MSTPASFTDSGEHHALALLSGTGEVAWALDRLRSVLPTLEPWAAPPAEVGLLLCALAAARPGAIPDDIARQLASVIERADLSLTAQPAVDEAFQLLELLVTGPAQTAIPVLVNHVLSTNGLHPRWFWKTVKLIQALADWQPGLLDVASLIAMAERSPERGASALFFAVIGPILLADPTAVDLSLMQRACVLPPEPSAARYVMNALAQDPDAPADVREWAASTVTAWFPLRPIWRTLFGGRAPRILCVQNIADGQGDEIIRVVPLIQALLDDQPENRITLITDRDYLYGHPRLELISFDDRARIARALDQPFDGLIEFFEPRIPHLNHETDLVRTIAAYRERHAPAFDLRASKGWNQFTFDSVRIDGFEWAGAFQLDQRLDDSVYDPTFRLIAELGLPLPGRTRSHFDRVLAAEDGLIRAPALTTVNHPPERVALLNPFGGSAALKGFVSRKFDDLVPLIGALVAEGYSVVICPTGTPWGSRALIDDLRARLPEDIRARTSVMPEPDATVPPSAAMRGIVSLVAEVDLVVTVEGWMMHAAFVNGKPYRLLLMPASGERDWQPWGRRHDQRVWYFQGDPALDDPPCPERPRRSAWLALLNRINHPCWQGVLPSITRSPDGDLRHAAWRALGRVAQHVPRTEFEQLLEDPSSKLRALGAEVLLERYPARMGDDAFTRPTLEGYRALGLVPYSGWEIVARLRSAALPALRAALHDADPVMRREAAGILEQYSRAFGPSQSENALEVSRDGTLHEP